MSFLNNGLLEQQLADRFTNLNPLEVEERRRRLERSPSPHSTSSTEPRTPRLSDFDFDAHRNATIRYLQDLSRPNWQFRREVADETERLDFDYDLGKFEGMGPFEKNVNIPAIAVCIVRDRWKDEGIWDSEWEQEEYKDIDNGWNINDYVGHKGYQKSGGSMPDSKPHCLPQWRHEAPLDNCIRCNSTEDLGRQLSRPSRRFEYALKRVKQGLTESILESSSSEKEALALRESLDIRAYHMVRLVWRRRRIWDSLWDDTGPGDQWRHEKTFLEYAASFPQDANIDVKSDEICEDGPIKLGVYLGDELTWDKLMELLSTGEDRKSMFASIHPPVRSPLPPLAFNPFSSLSFPAVDHEAWKRQNPRKAELPRRSERIKKKELTIQEPPRRSERIAKKQLAMQNKSTAKSRNSGEKRGTKGLKSREKHFPSRKRRR